jgi:hypothetical protein
VDLSLTTVYAFSHLEVIVIADDGWSWVLAWRQFGVQNIYALPLTDIVVEQLKTVKVLLKEIKVVDSMNTALQMLLAIYTSGIMYIRISYAMLSIVMIPDFFYQLHKNIQIQ